MTLDQSDVVRRVHADPNFHELVRRRSRFAWLLTALMVTVYFGFILTIAYFKSVTALSVAGGVTTVGIVLGLGVIIAAFTLTGIYVARANTTFDELTRKIVEGLAK